MEFEALVKKYDKPVPRYTSFPAMPNWRTDDFVAGDWAKEVRNGFRATNEDGISLYIHLPYCESLCTYCGCNTRITVNHAVELPYIHALLAEWKLYLKALGSKPVIREIHLGGGTPTFFSPENLEFLIKSILKTAELHPEHAFSLEGHPGNTTHGHLESLYHVGFRRVSYGIQDFDFKVQKAINRIQSYEEVKRVTDWARQIGYDSVNFDLIYGLPFQTEDSIRNTISRVAELMPDRIAYYSYAHVPWFKPGQRAYSEKDLPQGEAKRRLNALGKKELLSLGYRDIGMDHFALATDALFLAMQSGQLHRNFMGYTEHNSSFMIGLGTSAISDLGTAYGQNVKTVENYIDLVEAGQLPVFKGHIMSEFEQETRSLILDIICNRWMTSSDVERLPEDRKLIFEEMISEGLINVEWNDFKVTEKGVQFLRNICSVFDPNFGAQTGKKVFSQAV
ncbi:MAG: oxygen-independent coproporphyrinogen III oxidase [Roseivirga sp.]